ncbi:hypothetical protein F0562_012836 [Nyssa sinensis]|uniref:NET domain-containing protein n=1 Tax=Nyssa sinensis TaxID=561372 RepID=A0A5J4ZTP9_9ASTE|nr:hypothetical protein F0562_012836 [Nyssa sinensis]
MAELLLNIFEEKWAVIEAEYNPDWRYEMVRYVGLLTPTSRKTHPFPRPPEMRSLDRSESMTMTVDSKLKQSNFAPVGRAPIIKNSNSAFCQHDYEIEVDIDSVDAETLWELGRFVTNYKKSLSKNKRKAELALQARAEATNSVPAINPALAIVKSPKETKTNEKNVATSSPVQEEKQGDNASRSCSSSSSGSDSGSSSSDSDSDSSSVDGSDAGHSPRT